MMQNLAQTLVDVCQTIGQHAPLWTQGAGGNVSYKQTDTLWIKASGFRLDAVTATVGTACVALRMCRAALEKLALTDGLTVDAEQSYADMLQQCSGRNAPRPSMETGLHVVLQAPWVLHFHALSAVLMAHHAVHNPAAIATLFKTSGLSWALLPSTLPGLRLSLAAIPHKGCDVLLLAQHGVVLQGDDPKIMLAQWEALERAFADVFGYTTVSVRAAPSPTLLGQQSCPWRLYFPDAVVYADAMTRLLEPAEPLYTPDDPSFRLIADALSIDRNAAELWWATGLLYAACPSLASIAQDAASAITHLPTEQFRRRKHDDDERL